MTNRFRVSLTLKKKSLETQTESDPLAYEVPIQATSTTPPETIDTPVLPNLSLDPSLVDTPHAAQQTIKEWFQKYPGLAELRVNPIELDGSINSIYVLGKVGLFYHSRSGKVGRPRSIDWNATANAVMDQSLEHIRSSTNDAIESIDRFYADHQECSDLKIHPIAVQAPSSI